MAGPTGGRQNDKFIGTEGATGEASASENVARLSVRCNASLCGLHAARFTA
jgi:hypothetical protein